jgi:glycosyltransferase involved in cell wall biosynthesis
MNPLVSIVTPTYNRRAHLPALIACYRHQTYRNLEWIVLDDGRDAVGDVFEGVEGVRYVRSDEKMRIGAKRNELNRLARGEIIVAMDDDDYYPPDRVAACVAAFAAHPTIDLAGCSAMLLYYPSLDAIYAAPFHGPNHATNGTMAWRKRYAAAHRYDEYCTHAEETSFLENYRHPMIQLEPRSTIMVMCHADNTVDKNKMRKVPSPLRLEDVVADPALQAFYRRVK